MTTPTSSPAPLTGAIGLVGLVTTVVVGVLTDLGWPGYLVGLLVAAALWLALALGSLGLGGRPEVTPTAYALASGAAVLVGYFFVAAVGDGNPVWWAVGVVLVGALAPWSGAVVAREPDD